MEPNDEEGRLLDAIFAAIVERKFDLAKELLQRLREYIRSQPN